MSKKRVYNPKTKQYEEVEVNETQNTNRNGNESINVYNSSTKSFKDIAPTRSGNQSINVYDPSTRSFEDIAPVKKDTNKWFKGGAFEEDSGLGIFEIPSDITKTILGTGADAITKVGSTLWNMGGDLGKLGAGYIAKKADDIASLDEKYGYNEEAQKLRNFAQRTKDRIAGKDEETNKRLENANIFNRANEVVDKSSILGDKSDKIVESIGQIGGYAAASAVNPALGNAVMFGTSAGSSLGENYGKENVTDTQAWTNALAKGGISLATERAFGLFSKGKGIDTTIANKISSNLSSGFAKILARAGVQATGEALEEAMEYIGDQLLDLGMDAASQGKGAKFHEDWNWEELGAQMGNAFLSSLLVGAGQTALGVKNAEGSNIKEKVNEFAKQQDIANKSKSKNEQKVIDLLVQEQLEEKQKNGEKTNKKEITEQAEKDLEKGYVDIETIEEALGGDLYDQYQNILNQQEELNNKIETLENTKLSDMTYKQQEELKSLREQLENLNVEDIRKQLRSYVNDLTQNDPFIRNSYNEYNNKGNAYQVDLDSIDEKLRPTYERAMQSNILNDTNRTHDFVNLIAKLENDKGIKFNFTNNEHLKNTGFALDGKVVNGYITDDGIFLNIDSDKALNSVVGHEITHALEGSELYDALKTTIKDYAESRGEYEVKYNDLKELYKEVKDADIENEITADLVGDYLFTDEEFVNRLSVENRNLFQKIYDEIKYLAKLITTGSKEGRQLEKAKHLFEKVYRQQSTNIPSNTKYNAEVLDLEDIPRFNYSEALINEIENKTKEANKNNKDIIYLPTNKIAKYLTTGGARENGSFNKLVELIKNNGITEPIQLTKNKDGKISIYDGTHRLYIAKSMGLKEIPVSFVNVDNKAINDFVVANDVRYSLSPKGEMVDNVTGKNVKLDVSDAGTTGTLMAIHNLNESKLKGILELGGFPVPSIAITKVENTGSNQFGNISVLFDKSTIDPAIRENEVYDRDVWTPTFPRVEYDINNQMLRDLSKNNNFYDNNDDNIISHVRLNYMYADNLSDLVDRYGVENTLDKMKKDDELKYLYLKTKDNNYQAQMKPTKYSYDYSNDTLKEYVDLYNSNPINDMSLPEFYYHYLNYGDMNLTEDQTKALKSTVRDILYKEYKQQAEQEYEKNIENSNDLGKYKNNKDGFIDNYVNMMLESFDNSYFKYKEFIRDASRLDEFGETMSIDESNTLKKASEDVNQEEFEKWIDNTFGDMLNNATKGIRNDVDLFTPSGNRRSFDKLHDNYDLQSVVRYMTKQSTVAGEEGFGAGSGFGTIQAKMSNKFNTIDEIRNAANERIVPGNQEKDLLEPYSNTIYSDMEELLEYYKFKDEKYSYPMDTVGYMLNDFAGYKKQDLSSLKRALNEYSFETDKIPNELLNKVVDDINSLKNIPTDYFEAKPQRAVGLDEVQQVVIPNNLDTEFKQQLQDAGLQYTEYDPNIDGDRQRVINQFDDLKFSLSNQNEDIAPIGNYRIKGEDIKLQDIAPIETIQETKLETPKTEKTDLPIEPTKEEAYENKKTRAKVREELSDEMNITTEDLDVGKDISSLGYQRTDPIRLNEKVFGAEIGEKINNATIRKTYHNEAERTRFLNKERQEIKNLGIKARSKESAAVQKYGEKQYLNENNDLVPYTDADLAREFSDVATQEKIKKAAKEIRNKYDTYIDEINKAITEMGYDPIPKRQDYMRHFQEIGDKLSQWGIPLNKESLSKDTLPTDINGVTDQFKPGKNWFASAMQRKGLKTTYDAITGIDGYLEGASNLIYHTADIQRYRALAKQIRDTYGQSHGLDNMDLSTKEGQKRLNDIFDNKLSKYAAWLDEQANALAGKKGGIDRAAERLLGRRIYTIAETAKKQVGSNMTGFNVRSALTNFASAVQGASKTNKMAFIKGTVSTIKNMINNDGLIEKSDFLTNRFGSDNLSKKLWQKASNAGQTFMTGTDYFTANQIWRSKYYENLDSGMSESEAIKKADDFASRVMGDRAKGMTAEIFNSKTLGLLSQFQLEVNNQWSSIVHDNKMDLQRGNKSGATVMFQLGQLAAMSYMFNNFMKAMTGSDVMIDPIDLLKELLGWNDDDEETTLEERSEKVLGDLVNDLPFVSFMTGGRIPIQEAFTGAGTAINKITGQKDKYGNDITWEDVKGDAITSALYWLLPTGYGQLKKTSKGLSMYDENLPLPGSYTASGNLRFNVEDTTGEKIKAALFGEYSSEEAQKYRESGYKTISSKKIQELKDLGMNASEYRKYSEDLKEAGTTNADKIDFITNSNYTDEQKNIMGSNVLKKDFNVKEYKKYGSYEEADYAINNPEKYLISKVTTNSFNNYKKYLKEIGDIKADKDENGKSISNSRKNKVIDYISDLKEDAGSKMILYKMQYPSDDTYNSEIVEYLNNKNNITLSQEKTILQYLGMTITDEGTVRW